jgi:hypothetical protein
MRVLGQHLIIQDGHPAALDFGAGSLWLTFYPPKGTVNSAPSSGQLLRVDPGSGTVASRWPVGGSPVSVSAGAERVWVANSAGPGPAPAVAANQVVEFTVQGQAVHTYPVVNPIAVAASGDGAWVQYQQADGVYLRHLHDGSADPGVKLAADAPALSSSVVACADGRAYGASFDTVRQQTHVQQVGRQAQPPADAVLTVGGITTLACHASGVVALIADQGQGRLFPLPFTTPPTPPRSTNQQPGWLVGDRTSADVWLVTSGADASGDTRVQLLDRQNLAAGPPVVVDLEAILATAGGSRLWIVAEDPHSPDRVVITGVEAP